MRVVLSYSDFKDMDITKVDVHTQRQILPIKISFTVF